MSRVVRNSLAVSLAALVLAGVVLGAIYLAVKRVPAFYAKEMAVAAKTQENDSDAMLQQAVSFHGDLHRRHRWEQVFTDKKINAWLAVDLARNHPEALPQGMSDPRVRISPDGITLACRLKRFGVQGVVSLEVSARVESDDVISLRIRKARLGVLPWPLGQVVKAIADAARQADLRIQWRQVEGDPVALFTLAPDDSDRRDAVHIDTIRLEEGRLIVAGTTGAAK